MAEIPSFNGYPHITLLLHRGGVPGIDYLYVSKQNEHLFYAGGWEQTKGAPPAFLVDGIPCNVLCKGIPADGMSPGDSECKVFISRELDDLLGIEVEDAPTRTGGDEEDVTTDLRQVPQEDPPLVEGAQPVDGTPPGGDAPLVEGAG